VSSSSVWHAQSGQWQRLGSTSISPGTTISAKPIIGGSIASNLEADFESFETTCAGGPLLIRRSYAGSLVFPSTFAASNAGIDVGRRESIWSFKPTPSTFAAGGNDTWFNNFLDSIPSGHKTMIILWHEPEGELNKGQFTLADWKAANNRMGAMVHAKNRPELRSAICVIGSWGFDPRNPGVGTEFWDSGFTVNIDYIGFDPYNSGGDFTDLTNQPYFVEALDWASSHNKQVLLPEFGCSEDPNGDHTKKATWIQHTYQLGISANMYAMLYFNADGPGGTTMLTTTESKAAFTSINADSKI